MERKVYHLIMLLILIFTQFQVRVMQQILGIQQMEELFLEDVVIKLEHALEVVDHQVVKKILLIL